MKTATYAELCEKNNESLVAVDFPSSAREMRQVESAFGTRLKLIQAASTAKQRLAYGIERFQARYVVMEELRLPPEIAAGLRSRRDLVASEAAFRQDVWDALPNSPFKRFQEIFCEPRKFIVPRFTYDQETRDVTFHAELRQYARDLQPCLVSPDRISDPLVESLGIATFTQEERRSSSSPQKRFLRKAEDDVIEGIKARFECAVSFTRKDHRFLVFDRLLHTDALRAKYPSAPDMPPGLPGTLIYTSEDTNLSRRLEISEGAGLLQPLQAINRRAAHFTSGFDAARKTRHQRHTYERETPAIATLQGKLKSIKARITNDWREGAAIETKDAILADLKNCSSAALRLFENAIDPNKIGAQARIATARTGRDSIGRLNPTVTSVHLEKAITFLTARLKEISPKGGHNEQDRDLIEGALAEQSERIRQAASRVSELTATRAQNARAYQEKVKGIESELVQVKLQPLTLLAAAVRLLLRAPIAPAPTTQTDPLKTVAQVGHLLEALLATERIRSHIIDPRKIAPNYLHEQILALRVAFKGTSGEVRKRIADTGSCCTKCLKEYRSIPSRNTRAQTAWAEAFRIELDSFDILGALPRMHPVLESLPVERRERAPQSASVS